MAKIGRAGDPYQQDRFLGLNEAYYRIQARLFSTIQVVENVLDISALG